MNKMNQFEGHPGDVIREKIQSDLQDVREPSVWSGLRYLLRTPIPIGTGFLSKVRMYPGMQNGARLIADCLAVAAANLSAFIVRFDWVVPDKEVPHLFYGLPVACLAYCLSFMVLKTYRSIWRYASVEDLWQVIRSTFLGGSLHAVAVVLLGWRPYPRSIIVLTALFALLLMGGIRLLARFTVASQKAVPLGNGRKVVIIGAGNTGEWIAREICGNPALGYDLIGFVDDDLNKQGATIHNRPVLGTIEELPELAGVHAIQEAIVAVSTATGSEMRRISGTCTRANLEFKTLPSFTQLVRGDGRLRYLRKMDCDDLLRRAPTSIDEARIAEFLCGKRVMVTGAGGSIGSELCRQVLRLGAESLIMVERAENALYDISLEIQEQYPKVTSTAALADVKHIPRMSEIFQRFRPHIVFHAAAYKHVPILEDHPGEAVLNNVVGTKRLAEVAKTFGAETFVFISTDKAATPINLMGATKKICEMYVTALNRALSESGTRVGKTRFLVVRFGNVLGSAGSVVPMFQKQIENGDPITITDPEVSRFFMTVSEAVGLVLQSATLSSEADVFVLDMGEPVRISELADDLTMSLGLSPSEVTRKYVGLRPGDKLHEVLWEEGEEVLPSENEKIFAIRRPLKPLAEMEELLGQLESLAIRGNVKGLLRRIHDAVPSYRPSYGEPCFMVPEVGEKYRVLVVDDDEHMCELLRDALEPTYEMAIARSASEAMNCIDLQIPHLILLDVKLPDRGGVQVCQGLRAHPEYCQIPIIMMTAYGDRDSVVNGLRAGADDYLAKPFELGELEARVEAVLRRMAWS